MSDSGFIKKIKAIIIFLALFGVSSCGGEEVPEGILSEDEMVPIFLDVYLAEGKVNELRVKRDSALIIFEEYETRILDKYELTDSVYTNSLRYYYAHPLKLESIYETVLDSLNLMEKRLDEPKNDSKKEVDEDTANVKLEKVVGA
ncbi:MAG: DUF4296 domain-containing protein [Bacteroidota bacterium]